MAQLGAGVELAHLLIAAFDEAKDGTKAQPMQDYMRNKFVFFGVPRPERNAILKHFKPELKRLNEPETLDFAKYLWQQPQRELHYCAMDVLQWNVKKLSNNCLSEIEQLLVRHAWWDTVDILATNVIGVMVKREVDAFRSIFDRWIKSDNMWLNRTAIIFQLKYRKDTDKEMLTEAILLHAASSEFFLQKAIGWALRQYAKYNQPWVIDFVENNDLQPLSKREAMKHIR